MNCTICGRPIVLVPSASQRAAKDVTGKSAAYYTGLFTEHPQCVLRKRLAGDRALLRQLSRTKS